MQTWKQRIHENKAYKNTKIMCFCRPDVYFQWERLWTLCFSSCKNRKLKVKMWWVRACERKKKVFFVPMILLEENFFSICFLSQCKVYWTHFQKKHTFTYKKTLLQTLLCLFLKSSRTFSVSLKQRLKKVTYWLLKTYFLKSFVINFPTEP